MGPESGRSAGAHTEDSESVRRLAMPEIPNRLVERAQAVLDAGNAIVFFDGTCLLCNRAVHDISRHDGAAHFFFSSLQGELAKVLLPANGIANPESVGTLVLMEGGAVHVRSEAAIRIGRHLGLSRGFLAYVGATLPRELRDAAYDLIAENRKRWFGEMDACHLPERGEAERFL